MSQRRACRLAGQNRNTQRRPVPVTAIDEQKLRRRIRELARRHVRWGRRLVYRRLRKSGIQFVRHQQRHDGQAMEICRNRSVVYEQARQRHPRRWSRSTRSWRQPEVVWINQPPDDHNLKQKLTFKQAA